MFKASQLVDQFGKQFLNEETCRTWTLAQLHPEGPRCPQCRAPLPVVTHARFWRSERLKCPACSKFFTALTGTLLSGMHWDFSELVLIAILAKAGFSHAAIARRVGSDPDTVGVWRDKLAIFEVMAR